MALSAIRPQFSRHGMHGYNQRVVYTGECVRCRLHGYGEVVFGGEHPEVQFISGIRIWVLAASLVVVPAWMFEEIVVNQHAVERDLDLRVNGMTSRPEKVPPRPSFDLEWAMREQVTELPPRTSAASRGEGLLWFMGGETSEPIDRDDDHDPPPISKVVRVRPVRIHADC